MAGKGMKLIEDVVLVKNTAGKSLDESNYMQEDVVNRENFTVKFSGYIVTPEFFKEEVTSDIGDKDLSCGFI